MEREVEPKYYASIIMLGENCEPAFQFRRCFGFVESFPYNWCRMCNLEKFLEVFSNESLLWSEGVDYTLRNNMFMDKASNIYFHGTRSPREFESYTREELIKEEEKELNNLKGRTHHLLDKLHKVWHEGKSQLYVCALQIDCEDRIKKWVDTLKGILDERTGNFSILVVLNKKMKDLEFSVGGVNVRYLDHFTPLTKVTNVELSDMDGWNRIWQEFQPLKRKIEHKIYKFEK